MDAPTISLMLGLLIGLIMSLTGAGGTVVSVPLLVFGLHLPITQAAPVGLLAVLLAAGTGGILGLKAGVVRYKAGLLMAAFGLVCAPVGIWLAHSLPHHALTLLFCAVLAYVAIRMWRQAAQEADALGWDENRPPPVCKLDPYRGKFSWTAPCARRMMLSGSVAGMLSGLLGVGGGFVIVPALRAVSDLDIKSIVATSLFTITLVSAGSVMLAISRGAMDWGIALPFAGAAVIGMLTGGQVSGRIAGPHIQRAFAVLALLMVCGLIIKQVF